MNAPTGNNAEKIVISQNTETEAFYHGYMPLLTEARTFLATEMERLRCECTAAMGINPIDHWNIRLKPVASGKSKLQRLGYPTVGEVAVTKLHDVIGARAVCAFIDDIIFIRQWFYRQSAFTVVEEKDYIKHPKPNGYRSCHLIVRILPCDTVIGAEIQLRTLAMDCWAALEHQLRYKNENNTQELIVQELKRCSDEFASADWNLLAIREMTERHIEFNELLLSQGGEL